MNSQCLMSNGSFPGLVDRKSPAFQNEPTAEYSSARPFSHWSLGIHWSLVIGHWSLTPVLGHRSFTPAPYRPGKCCIPRPHPWFAAIFVFLFVTICFDICRGQNIIGESSTFLAANPAKLTEMDFSEF